MFEIPTLTLYVVPLKNIMFWLIESNDTELYFLITVVRPETSEAK